MATTSYLESTPSLAASCGNAFDAMLKVKLSEDMGLTSLTLNEMVEKNVAIQFRDEATAIATRLFKEYVANGCYKRLLARKILYIDMDKTGIIEYNGSEVPVRGLPDFVLQDGTIGECKVSGAGSVHGQSPCPGYMSNYVRGVNKGAHAKYGFPFEELNEGWATQLAIYSWLYRGVNNLAPINVLVENIAVRPASVSYATILATISTHFQETLYRQLVEAWNNISNGKIEKPTFAKSKCFAWGGVCEFASQCPGYAEYENAPEDIKLLKGW
jgi:hypothetical protein